ncbi:endonuclease/exonuclease/phosphatase family protein [Streptomyces sp. NPDC021218]|uniref:endonuclease/exonuclease/phosphatase family protein n=1 Tax=unclassified Streptomyces TaxID=2593676 RepID=UPI0036A867BB
MSPVPRVVTFNTLFGGHTDSGSGPTDRWDGQTKFLRPLRPDVLALQELNFFEQLGRRRLHRAVTELAMAQGFLAEANVTTAGHRLHSAILLSDRVRVDAEGTDRTRYHHVMGWANLIVPGAHGLVEVRNLHLDPFDPRNRAREAAPLEILAAPGRLSLVVGDINSIGGGQLQPTRAVGERRAVLGKPTEQRGQRRFVLQVAATPCQDLADGVLDLRLALRVRGERGDELLHRHLIRLAVARVQHGATVGSACVKGPPLCSVGHAGSSRVAARRRARCHFKVILSPGDTGKANRPAAHHRSRVSAMRPTYDARCSRVSPGAPRHGCSRVSSSHGYRVGRGVVVAGRLAHRD